MICSLFNECGPLVVCGGRSTRHDDSSRDPREGTAKERIRKVPNMNSGASASVAMGMSVLVARVVKAWYRLAERSLRGTGGLIDEDLAVTACEGIQHSRDYELRRILLYVQ